MKVLYGVAAMATLFNTLGCSLFSPRIANGGPENANFRQQASVSSNPIPLPVEIVSDITTIASGGNIPQEGVWRPSYPEIENTGVPETDVTAVTMNADGTVKESDTEVDDTSAAATPTGKLKVMRRRVASAGGKTETYKVRGGDTLMKISFEKYGNIYRWREIYDSNKSRIANLNKLTAGTLLTIQGIEYIVIERNGSPYLIRRGDTLVKISKNIYNTPTEWKALWKNNRQLIHDPNKIYAGFTMYYVPNKTEELPQQVRQISTEKPGVRPSASVPGKPSASTQKSAPVVPRVSTAARAVARPVARPEGTAPEARLIPSPNVAPASVAVPSATEEAAWTASPATPMDVIPPAPTAKP